MKVLICLVSFLILFAPSSKATHIVGGELNYRQLKSFNYEIRLTVFRDCINGIPPFDATATIGVFNSNNGIVDTLAMNFTFSTRVPSTLLDDCLEPGTDVCYEVTTYIDTFHFPPINGGYQLAYQRCCRNATISNITSPNGTGGTYYAHIPDTAKVKVNSNPTFNQISPTFICLGKQFTFDHSATDVDGDSLVYKLFHPYSAPLKSDILLPPANPPYSKVNWSNPYFTENMLGGNTPLAINSVTGLLTAIPNITGQFVIGVRVLEYRNGILLSETTRDYQFNVITCNLVTIASLATPNFTCGELNASFVNLSSGEIGRFLWNFGDLTTNLDTSSSFAPTYTYPDTGTFNVRLIAYSTVQPKCNDTSFSKVIIRPKYEQQITYISDPCTKEVSFNVTTSIDSLTSIDYSWNFGDNSTASTQRNPTHTFITPGNYTISLISKSPTNSGCFDSSSVLVNILPQYKETSNIEVLPCSQTVNFSANTNFDSLFPIKYSWDFGDQLIESDTANRNNGSFTFRNAGDYTAKLITSIADSNCFDTSEFQLKIPPNFLFNFIVNEKECSPDINFQASSTYDNFEETKYIWDFGEDTVIQDSGKFTFEEVGDFTIQLKVTTANGCIDSAYYDLTIEPLNKISVPNVFTPNGDGINDHLVVQGDISSISIYNRWGLKVFESNSELNSWDGQLSGKQVREGVYFYHLTPGCSTPDSKFYKGTVTLIR